MQQSFSLEKEIRTLLGICSEDTHFHYTVEISAADPSCATVAIESLGHGDPLAAAEGCLSTLRRNGFLIIKQPYSASAQSTLFTVCKTNECASAMKG
jgi:hypothetical protein